MKNIKVAIAGVGNCCSSLVQSVVAAKNGQLTTGLSFLRFAQYAASDIEFVAAFDVDERKLRKDLSTGIFTSPNCTTKYVDVPVLDVPVLPGLLLDGVSPHMSQVVHVSPEVQKVSIEDVTQALRVAKAEILVCYLPVGSQKAAEAYAQASLRANCAFVNCTPARIATAEPWPLRFKEAGLPLLGDDVKSQIGSTAIHRALISLLERKGVKINQTYQLNIGGNTDFMNMRNPDRGINKKLTKEISIKHLFDVLPDIGVGPSDYIPHLKDFKVGFINIEGVGLLGVPFSIELRIKVEDSPNSADVVLNAIRAAKVALDRGLIGAIIDVCGALFKNPPELMNEEEAFFSLETFSKTEKVELERVAKTEGDYT